MLTAAGSSSQGLGCQAGRTAGTDSIVDLGTSVVPRSVGSGSHSSVHSQSQSKPPPVCSKQIVVEQSRSIQGTEAEAGVDLGGGVVLAAAAHGTEMR